MGLYHNYYTVIPHILRPIYINTQKPNFFYNDPIFPIKFFKRFLIKGIIPFL